MEGPWRRIRAVALGVIAAGLMAMLFAVGFVALLVAIPILVLLFLVVRWYVKRRIAEAGPDGRIIEGVAVDITREETRVEVLPRRRPPLE